MTLQVVDPVASRAVFDREITEYREHEAEYRRMGWLLLEATYPTVLVAMVAVHVGPVPPVMFGLHFDYTNYPVEPPSLRFVNPFTGEEVPWEKLPNRLLKGRKLQVPVPNMPEVNQELIVPENELVIHHEGGPAFLCHPGVREYHNHPAHTGDAWELHAGEGRLSRLLDIVCRFGVRPVQTQVQVNVTYQQKEPGV